MQRRTFGDTGLEVSAISLGCWIFGVDWWGHYTQEDANRICSFSYDRGVTFFDNGDAYGNGRAETLFGQWVRDAKIDRAKIQIGGKFGYDFYTDPGTPGSHRERKQDFSPEFMRKALEQSLTRLGTDYLDLYMAHNIKLPQYRDDMFAELEKLKSEGKVKAWGVSLGPAIGWYEEGIKAITDHNAKAVQTVFNLFEQDPGRAFCQTAVAHRAGVMARVHDNSSILKDVVKVDTVIGNYGVQTARALENFRISGVELRSYPNFIKALAMVKLAAARANHDTGGLPADLLNGIERACTEIIGGALHDQFRLDVFQGGAGTSTNMNANEVIANRALELIGRGKGEYKYLDPHDHVNRSQSTNDSYPTAMHVGMALGNAELASAFTALIGAFRRKAEEFAPFVKMGRTQLQDAVPMTLGQEFNAFAKTLADEVRALERVQQVLCEVSMGGTAIGTGLNAPAGFAERCTLHLAEVSGLPLVLADDLVEATQDTQAFVLYSSALKSLAIKLAKVGNDLRLLSSGPRCGLHEINLPATQAGSSIMPGKVNPVIPEVTNMVAYRVIGNDLVVTLSAEAGQLQLNAFEPVIAAVIFEGQTLLRNAANTLRSFCVEGITANEAVLKHYLEYSIGTVTALNPIIGYDKATELAAEALAKDEGIVALVREKQILTDEQIDEILDPAALTGQGR